MIFITIASRFGGNQKKFGNRGYVFTNRSVLFPVYIENISVGKPKQSEIMELVFIHLFSANLTALHILTVTAREYVMRYDRSIRMEIFHNIHLGTRHFRVE